MDSISNKLNSLDITKDSTSTSQPYSKRTKCSKCGGDKEKDIEALGRTFRVRVQCDCEAKAYKKAKQEEEQVQKQQRLKKLSKHSLMTAEFRKKRFEAFEQDETNRPFYNTAKKYADNFKQVEEENLGMILYGEPGTGKSFLGFAIANQLLDQLTPVIAISSIGLLSQIKDTYKKYGDQGEYEIINNLKNASLLVLDDLGAENTTEWTTEKLYEIIDSRSRYGKPLVVTTNLTPEQLKRKLTSSDGVARTYDRLIEMCVQINVTSKPRRREIGEAKKAALKKIMRN